MELYRLHFVVVQVTRFFGGITMRITAVTGAFALGAIPVALVLLGTALRPASGASSSELSPRASIVPAVGAELAASPSLDTAVFAGGCFWGVEAVYEHVKGVADVVSGYAGGDVANPSYREVGSGDTGHAESVRVVYDPSVVSYGQLLQVFFFVAHDPTQLNRQGPDVGTQYRSAIFYRTAEQKKAAASYIAQLEKAKAHSRPVVTQVDSLRAFYPAEAYHQDYLVHHPNQPYIVINDAPKLEHLKARFPSLYRESAAD
jgi:peptide-methionine (S)-S-oxide reductase